MNLRQSLHAFILLTLFAACAAPDKGGPETAAPIAELNAAPGLNERFVAEDGVSIDDATATFEGESREVAVHRDAIVAALGIERGDVVADIGAGTGLFLAPFNAAVGPRGKVFAVDIAPRFVEHMRERAGREGLAQVEAVLCTEKSVELPPRSTDLAFVCDTYHHFEYPRNTLASLFSALRPGGELVVLDFERIPGVSREWILGHVRADKATFRAEIEAAGFEFVEELELPLVENYVLRFRRP